MIKAEEVNVISSHYQPILSDIFYEISEFFPTFRHGNSREKNYFIKRYNFKYMFATTKINKILKVKKPIIIKVGNQYKITVFGYNLFYCFYLVGFRNMMPSKFVFYYDDKKNTIDIKRTVFTLKLMGDCISDKS